MKITIRCNNCKKELEIKNSTISKDSVEFLVELLIAPCSNPDCQNCSRCEQVQKCFE